jgi:hypothetical protein
MPKAGGISAAGASKSTDRRHWEKPLTLSPLFPSPLGGGKSGRGVGGRFGTKTAGEILPPGVVKRLCTDG